MADEKITDMPAVTAAGIDADDLVEVVVDGTNSQVEVVELAAAVATQGSLATAGDIASAVSAHAGASDPHGDRVHAAGLVDDLSGVTDASTARTNLGLGSAATQASSAFDAAGSAAAAQAAAIAASQPVDSDLTAIAALTTTAYGRALLELANAAALRTAAGLVIGTDVQAFDAELAALAGLTSAANKLPYFTGAGTAALLDIIPGVWTAFTPTLSSGWALGNSTHEAKYARWGRLVAFYAVINIGSSATKGTEMKMALPVEAVADAGMIPMVHGLFHDVGTTAVRCVPGFTSSTLGAATTVTLFAMGAAGTYVNEVNVTASVPFTWVTGDRICVAGIYEASS